MRHREIERIEEGRKGSIEKEKDNEWQKDPQRPLDVYFFKYVNQIVIIMYTSYPLLIICIIIIWKEMEYS